MSTEKVKVPVSEILAGDTFVHQDKTIWTAVEDAFVRQGATCIRVQFCADGGITDRVWDDPSYLLTVERKVAS